MSNLETRKFKILKSLYSVLEDRSPITASLLYLYKRFITALTWFASLFSSIEGSFSKIALTRKEFY